MQTDSPVERPIEIDLEGMGIADIRRLARRTLSRAAREHQAATESGATLRRNQQAFRKLLFRQRIFHDVVDPELSIELFGRQVSMPVCIAPLGSFHHAAADGDRQVAESAGRYGVMAFPSHAGPTTVRDWSRWTTTPLVFMGQARKGRHDLLEHVLEAQALGYAAVGLSMDSITPTKLRHSFPLSHDGSPRVGYPALPSDIEWLKSRTSLPVVVKGIMDSRDSVVAADAGADAVVVSNHGARHLDYGLAALEVLPEVVDAVGTRVDVLFDSGIRSGGDVVKALALGAKAVLVGRPIYWALGVAGARGVDRVLEIFREEIQRVLISTGTPSAREVSPSIIVRIP